MKKFFTFALIAFFGLFIASSQAFAQVETNTGCQPIYGGGAACLESNQLSINKKVLNPRVNVQPGQTFNDRDFIDNVNPNDPRYSANKATAFRIFVTNKTNNTLRNITVRDIFPPRYLTFVSGDGEYDNNTRTFTATINELRARETKSITIQVLTARTDQLPRDNSSLCTINIASATVNNQTSQDTAQLCVSREGVTPTQAAGTPGPTAPAPTNPPTTKGGLPVVPPVSPQPGQRTPDTGPELLALVGLLPAGLAGMALRKKTHK